MRLPCVCLSVVLVNLTACTPPESDRTAESSARGASDTGQPKDYDSRFEHLTARQQDLVTVWFERYGSSSGQTVVPEEAYNQLPLSTKTTFEAVTHALMHTKLTDQSGLSLGDALDLLSQLDGVKGKIKNGSGDQQFRIYVQLADDAVTRLTNSTEFKRGTDNTVFHEGYPMNFRMQGGVPSIQFSVSADAQFADIDVDYRSSQFPASLFNGHLSSANSDVRAGNNHDKHVGGWDGLEQWWSGWEGLGEWRAALVAARGGEPPPAPRKGGGAPEVAVHDFLSAWLVEQQLDVALAYFSTEVNKCLPSDDESPTLLSPRQRLTQNMAMTNQVLGQPSRLADAIQGVHLGELELVSQASNEYHQQFVLSSVPADRVVEFDCAFKGVSVPEAYRDVLSRRGEYKLATFYLGTSEMRGATIALLWKREPDGWRVVSYELEPALGLVPDLRVQTRDVRTRETVPADPDFVRSHEAFIGAWLVDKDYDTAIGFFTNESRACVDLFSDDGSNRVPLREGFQDIAEFIGPIKRESLDQAIEGVTPSGAEFKLVEPQTNAYTLVSLPDTLAESFDCTTPPEQRTPVSTRGDSATGNYYASLFRLKVVGERPAPFFTVWAKQNSAWKIIAFELISS